MKLHTVCATCFLPDLVAELAGNNPYEKVIIFCEDKFTLSLELALAKRWGGTFNTNVFTFNRYIKKYFSNDKKCLSKEGCVLVVKRILLENKELLRCLKNVNDPNLASAVYELIAQLKSAKITPKDINNAALNEGNGNLNRKLFDIGLIFEKFEQFILENELTDGNNRLYRLPEFFNKDEELKSSRVIIAGFPSLNKTLCEIFKSIYKNAKDLCFAVVAGENENLYTNETYNFAFNQFPCEVIRHEQDKLHEQLLQGLYDASSTGKGFTNDKIFSFSAKNAELEITAIARYIRKEVMAGARYRQFALCVESVDDYELLIKRVFSDYELPFFIDKNKNLGKHPLTRLVCDFLDVINRNYDIDCVLRLIKNPLFTSDREIAEAFEQYCIRYAINRKSIRREFGYSDERIEDIENVRKKLMAVTALVGKGMSFSDCAQGITKMLSELNVVEKLAQLTDGLKGIQNRELGAFNERAEKRFSEVLEEAVWLIGGQKLSLNEVRTVILSGMTACNIPLIPEYSDCVFVGDFRAIKYSQYHTLFVAGLIDTVPSSKLDTALLCDRDIDVLKNCEVLIAPKIKDVNRRSRENACMALASFTEKLILSYPKVSTDGKRADRSEIVEGFKRVFSEASLPQKVGENLAPTYLTARTAMASFIKDTNEFKEGKIRDFSPASAYYKLMKDTPTIAQIECFLQDVNREVGYIKDGVRYVDKTMSATAIEGYFNCPYANFLSRGLKLKERAENHIMANDLGTMVHAVAEEFVNHIAKDGQDVTKLKSKDGIAYIDYDSSLQSAIALAKECFEKVVSHEEYARYTKSEGGKRTFELIKRECIRFCSDLFMGAKNSSFKPYKIEADFGYKNSPPISIKTKHGIMGVTGKVDRLDCFNNQMRIIDYKTGVVKPGEVEESLYTGKKLQLFLYAKAYEDKYSPAGVYYFPIQDDFSEVGQSGIMTLQGRTLADDGVARALDHTIDEQNTKGSYIDINIKKNKNGEYSYSKKLLTSAEFMEYLNYAKAVAGKGLEEMAEGVIIATPYENSCDYCKYHGICGYDEAVDARTRRAGEVDKDTILSALYVERLGVQNNDCPTCEDGLNNDKGGKE